MFAHLGSSSRRSNDDQRHAAGSGVPRTPVRGARRPPRPPRTGATRRAAFPPQYVQSGARLAPGARLVCAVASSWGVRRTTKKNADLPWVARAAFAGAGPPRRAPRTGGDPTSSLPSPICAKATSVGSRRALRPRSASLGVRHLIARDSDSRQKKRRPPLGRARPRFCGCGTSATRVARRRSPDEKPSLVNP